MNIERIVREPNAEDYFPKFYEDSSLTFIGMVPKEADLYVDEMRKYTKVDDSKTMYLTTGYYMNLMYDLKGDNAYPEDLNILIIPLDAFEDVGKIAIPMRGIGGRWFDDIVDNNARRGGREQFGIREEA